MSVLNNIFTCCFLKEMSTEIAVKRRMLMVINDLDIKIIESLNIKIIDCNMIFFSTGGHGFKIIKGLTKNHLKCL